MLYGRQLMAARTANADAVIMHKSTDGIDTQIDEILRYGSIVRARQCKLESGAKPGEGRSVDASKATRRDPFVRAARACVSGNIVDQTPHRPQARTPLPHLLCVDICFERDVLRSITQADCEALIIRTCAARAHGIPHPEKTGAGVEGNAYNIFCMRVSFPFEFY